MSVVVAAAGAMIELVGAVATAFVVDIGEVGLYDTEIVVGVVAE